MEKRKVGSIVTKNGKLYARVRFTDESGKKRDNRKSATSKKEIGIRKIICTKLFMSTSAKYQVFVTPSRINTT